MLAGCSLGSPMSNFAFPSLPRATIPDIQLMGVPLYGEKPGVKLTPTTPYELSPTEADVVRLAVTRSFPDASGISFYPLRSGLTTQGTVAVCGMVSARSGDGAADDRLFRGELSRQTGPTGPTFAVKQIGGANAATLDVYGDCQKQGLA